MCHTYSSTIIHAMVVEIIMMTIIIISCTTSWSVFFFFSVVRTNEGLPCWMYKNMNFKLHKKEWGTVQKSLTSFFVVLRAVVCIYGNVLEAPFSTAGESCLLVRREIIPCFTFTLVYSLLNSHGKKEKKDTVPPVGVIIPIYYSLGMPCVA